ncbi:PTS system fructose-specific transporter subunit IIB [Klebsiella pneumoniae subsp. pneumoniae]|uniref:PTS system fructose-specific transporter subunit IIB n=1 Tax=Klebsiella pneumoniae subsp. pneumoniae TaxID=72407 RepID=A0A377ZCH1_KLEPN|nr:PTS system fructose-specific transporter subunit IIB [Klebsiella pneumoniae subsp. pneumoniae]
MYRYGRAGKQSGYAFGVGLLSTQTYAPMAAIMAAGMVPPLAMGIATLVARNKFDKGQREGGKAALVLGLCFISEGAIPFAARDPMRVLPCCIVGGAVTGAISMAVGAKLMAPHGGLFVLLIPGAITPVLGYLLAIVAGTLVAGLAYAVLNALRRKQRKLKKRYNPTAIKKGRLFGLFCLYLRHFGNLLRRSQAISSAQISGLMVSRISGIPSKRLSCMIQLKQSWPMLPSPRLW